MACGRGCRVSGVDVVGVRGRVFVVGCRAVACVVVSCMLSGAWCSGEGVWCVE